MLIHDIAGNAIHYDMFPSKINKGEKQNTKRKTQNTKHKTQNAKHKTQNTKRKTQTHN